MKECQCWDEYRPHHQKSMISEFVIRYPGINVTQCVFYKYNTVSCNAFFSGLHYILYKLVVPMLDECYQLLMQFSKLDPVSLV